MTDEQLEALYSTAMTVTRRNASSKWGHPKYTATASSQELGTLYDGAVMLVRECRESERLASLTDEERGELLSLLSEMQNAERLSPDIMYYPTRRIQQRRVLAKLLGQRVL